MARDVINPSFHADLQANCQNDNDDSAVDTQIASIIYRIFPFDIGLRLSGRGARLRRRFFFGGDPQFLPMARTSLAHHQLRISTS